MTDYFLNGDGFWFLIGGAFFMLLAIGSLIHRAFRRYEEPETGWKVVAAQMAAGSDRGVGSTMEVGGNWPQSLRDGGIH